MYKRQTYDTDADGHDLLRFEDSAMHDAALRYTEHRINKLTLSGELLETVSRIGGDRFHAVSYTHLDVYKRQALIHVPCERAGA